jgi:uncharacterized protein (DUF362 family)
LAVRQLCSTGFLRDRRRRRSRVAILHEDSYDGPLDRTLIEGLRLFDLNLRGKAVLLKPNLVEYIPGAEVNTNPRLVGAAASAFLALGAKTVLVGEGPGHQRDTVLVLAAADCICTRLMGLNPLRVKYLAQAAEFLGNGTAERIVQLGEMLPPAMQPFAVLPEFAHLRL